MSRAVFLDRDGVLLDLTRQHAWQQCGAVIPGTRAALRRLKADGWLIAMVTNQPDIADGKIKREIVDRIHANLREILPWDFMMVCPHNDADKCNCRKPKAGMLLQIAERAHIDLPASYMVGDRWRDISAGGAAGCQTILIGTAYGEPLRDKPDFRAADLTHAVDIILGAI